jgi:hypothetical protein
LSELKKFLRDICCCFVGFNPIWDEFCEFTVRLPEMAFIHFVVKDHFGTGKDVTLGQYMLAFPAIMEGIKNIDKLFIKNALKK